MDVGVKVNASANVFLDCTDRVAAKHAEKRVIAAVLEIKGVPVVRVGYAKNKIDHRLRARIGRVT